MVRSDTYEIDCPRDDPNDYEHATFQSAKTRKEELVKDGWRVKIRKNANGKFVVHKKHDELLHGQSWRKEQNG